MRWIALKATNFTMNCYDNLFCLIELNHWHPVLEGKIPGSTLFHQQ